MGWKSINGREYYYRSKRVGDRVESSYFGAGESALFFALLDAEDRAEREEERATERAELQEAKSEERDIADWFGRVQTLADAAMIAAGFQRHHRGEWRRRRDGHGTNLRED
jgi:hypothetical protein